APRSGHEMSAGQTPVNAISARDVTVTFDTATGPMTVLGPCNVDIPEGQFVCLVGPSGCGKSTLVRIVAGLLSPTSGTLDVTVRDRAPSPMATVFQDFGIFPWKTVRANLELGLRVRGTSAKEARSVAMDWLGRLGLSKFA